MHRPGESCRHARPAPSAVPTFCSRSRQRTLTVGLPGRWLSWRPSPRHQRTFAQGCACFRAVGSVLGFEHQPCSEAVCPDDRMHLSSGRWLRDVVRRGREGTNLSALTDACLPPLLCLAATPLHPVTWDLGFGRNATPWAWSLLP